MSTATRLIAMMAGTWTLSSYFAGANSAAEDIGNFTISEPGLARAGDILFLTIFDSSGAVVTGGAGGVWASLPRTGGHNGIAEFLWKIAAVGDLGATFTVTGTFSAGLPAALYIYRGGSTLNKIGDTSSFASPITYGGFVKSSTSKAVIALFLNGDNTNPTSIPTNFTQHVQTIRSSVQIVLTDSITYVNSAPISFGFTHQGASVSVFEII